MANTMRLNSDLRIELDTNRNIYSHTMACPSTASSFSSATSACAAAAPASLRSGSSKQTLDFDASSGPSHCADEAHPLSTNNMPKYMFDNVKLELDYMSTQAKPSTPIPKVEHIDKSILGMNIPHQQATSVISHSNSFTNIPTISPHADTGPGSFMMSAINSLAGSDTADSSPLWSYANDDRIVFCPHEKSPSSHHPESLDLERHFQSRIGCYYYTPVLTSPYHFHAHHKMMLNEIQRKTAQLQHAQTRASSKISEKSQSNSVDVARKAKYRCDYHGCYKVFRRTEHLKRHKQTSHGEGPNRFSCEFCGKNQFNRQDNLNNHRKLHTRPNRHNRGVEFIAAAVPIIEYEERNRKRRTPAKAKVADKNEATEQFATNPTSLE